MFDVEINTNRSIIFRASFKQLDSASKMNVNSLGMNITVRKTPQYAKFREDIVNFLLYVRNYVQRWADMLEMNHDLVKITR